MSRIEIESLQKLKQQLDKSSDLTGAVFQSLELRQEHAELLKNAILHDNLLLGCDFDPVILAMFNRSIVIPEIEGLPYNPYRAFLYTPEELLGKYEIGEPDSYKDTIDGATYAQYLTELGSETMDVRQTLTRRLHDYAITDALQEFIQNRKVVAIMGGHSVPRNAPVYREVAFLARELTRMGMLTTSGGGPGAMEATHLGAWFAERDDAELDDAIHMLSEAPLYKPQHLWLDTAFKVVEKYPVTSEAKCLSLGIPTWLYGHEPPTCFALRIAKYFANSVREEGLLAIALNGVIFAPGSAGTIQEIFQDACQNHYKSFKMASPMIFFGKEYWEKEKPVYPLVKLLAAGMEYEKHLSITDDRSEIVESIKQFADRLLT